MRAADLRAVTLRIRLAGVALLACFALLALRAVHLTVLDPRGADLGDIQAHTVLRIPPERGVILDRAGSPLAVSVRAPSIFADPREIEDLDATARALAKTLRRDPAAVRRRLASRLPFVFVARWVKTEQAEAVEKLQLAGVGVVHEPKRVHPHRALAGQLLGFANIDGEGVRGIERQEDAWLRGHARQVAVERDARQRLLASGDVDPRSAAGGEIALTLDAALQADAEAALEEAIEAHEARGGVIVALDPRRGEVLALAERPAFDPDDFRSTAFANTRARGFLDALEPGSTLKPFLVAAALEQGVLNADDVIDCEGGMLRVPGRLLRDRHPHDLLGVADVLRVSSNIGAVKIGMRLGPEAHHTMLRRFGFGATTESGFPEESAGLLRPPETWRPLDHATIAFGQGLSVTPLQLAVATAVLASEGEWRPPRLVAARRRPGEAWQPEAPAATKRVLRPEVAHTVLEMMESVVGPEGTGSRAGLRGVRVAGKTGTAQKIEAETGAYSTDRYLAWFTGVAPADDPQLVAVIVIDEPMGPAHTGGAVAAPVFAAISAAHLARRGIATEPSVPMLRAERKEAPARTIAKPSAPTVPTRAKAPAQVAKAQAAKTPSAPVSAAPAPPSPTPRTSIAQLGDRLLLPDFRGLRPDEVKSLMAASAVQLEIQGDGHAVAQEPAPGTVVPAHSSRVRVRFARGGEEG